MIIIASVVIVVLSLVDLPLELLLIVIDNLDLVSLSSLIRSAKYLYIALIGKLYLIALMYTYKLSSSLTIRLGNIIPYYVVRKKEIVLE